METYTLMRHFADSWGLLAMMLFFLGVVAFIFLPGAKKAAERAASIPFDHDVIGSEKSERHPGGKPLHTFPHAARKED
ncbi:cytochrome c oxidase cbb3-type subunit 4 [Sinorhizobium terangae]|uniref:CcoQ/FixQ family Cbb3-type cytochrome c oxidase assembly chaperone n=1 Tax=Sinorhizobium terangae TaxID=110322 RepID=A0A6N7LHJ4_SINTE|nr:cytochrome c oxidase cbb3-type subunit 4 [Sinorhizobium terangae]MQX16224.1 CcoQ/FixQ family Cbb3-type cytochrome c oxidase assembly chaperone [Sinorhizobium terangae]